jgi:DNA-binding MarR family transcriptional regulator
VNSSEVTAAGLIVEIAHAITSACDRHLQEAFGLPLVSFEVLVRLYRSPGQQLRLADLADQVTMTRSGLTRAIDRLEVDALVRREPCADDRRGTWAVLTDDGIALLDPVIKSHVEFLRSEVLAPLSTEQSEDLIELLEPIRDFVNPVAAAASRFPAIREEPSASPR